MATRIFQRGQAAQPSSAQRGPVPQANLSVDARPRRSLAERIAERRLVAQAQMIADYARDVLQNTFRDADWIEQAVDAVARASDKAIRQLSGMNHVTQNVEPLKNGSCYVFPARTKDEILASRNQVADQRAVPPEAKPEELLDPMVQAPVQAPVQKKIVAPKGWLL